MAYGLKVSSCHPLNKLILQASNFLKFAEGPYLRNWIALNFTSTTNNGEFLIFAKSSCH